MTSEADVGRALSMVQDFLKPRVAEQLDAVAMQMHGKDRQAAGEELARASQVLFRRVLEMTPDVSPSIVKGLIIAFNEMVRARLEEFDMASNAGGQT